MFKIGEFSRLTMVSVRMLRYYDEHHLLKPAKIDKFTGYRLYDVSQIKEINKIIFLRDAGFSIAEIKSILNHWETEYVYSELIKKHHAVTNLIDTEKQRLHRIEKALLDISNETIETNYNIQLKSLPSYKVISLRKILSDHFLEGELWEELGVFIKSRNIPVANKNNIAIYHDLEFKETDVDVEVCSELLTDIIINTKFIRTHEIPAVEKMAYTMVYGPFENINSGFRSFARWIDESPYTITGLTRQIVHKGPWNESNPEKYLTEIQIELA